MSKNVINQNRLEEIGQTEVRITTTTGKEYINVIMLRDQENDQDYILATNKNSVSIIPRIKKDK